MRKIMKTKSICLFLALLLSVCVVIGIGSTVSKYTAKSDVATFDVTFVGGNHTLQPGMAINRLIDELQETTKARKIVFGSYNELGVANNIAWNDESAIEMGELAGDFRAFPITEEDGTAAIYILAAGSKKVIANPDSSWMFWYSGLTQIEGLENLDTSKVTDMSHMFHNLSSIETLDLSGFDTSKVENMKRMFYDCTSLTTVYVGEKWSTDAVTNSEQMFTYAKKLVGGQGTVYNQSYVDKTYARIDEKLTSGTLGYFTDISATFSYTLTDGRNFNFAIAKLLRSEMDVNKLQFGTFAEYESKLDGATWESSTVELGMENDTIRAFVNGDTVYVLTKDNGKFVANADCSNMFLHNIIDEGFIGTYPNLSHIIYPNIPEARLTAINGLDLIDTSNVENMNNMFSYCRVLTSLDVSKFNTEKVTDMSNMFSSCNALTSLDVSKFNTESVTDMSGMFSGCSNVTELDVSGFDTANVTNMAGMFYYCGAAELDLSKFNTSKVTDMHEMFSFSEVTSLNLLSFDTSNVEFIYAMFSGCSSLESITFPETVDLNKVTVDAETGAGLTHFFSGCTVLKEVDLSGFKTENVKRFSYMFTNCDAITTLDLSMLDTSSALDVPMFNDSENLVSVDLSNFNTSKVTRLANTFDGCTSLKSVDLSSFDTSNMTEITSVFAGCKSLETLDLSSFDTSKVKYIYSLFNDCVNLKTIYVSDKWNMDALALTHTTGMFLNCTSLVGGQGTVYDAAHIDHIYARIDEAITANIPGYLTLKGAPALDNTLKTGSEFNTAVDTSVTKITFGNYADYKTNFSTWTDGMILDSGNVGTIRLFKNGTEAYVLSNGGEIMANAQCDKMFRNMSALTEIVNLDLVNTENATTMKYMFSDCSALTLADVSKFDTKNVTDMAYMFSGCSALTLADVSKFDTKNVTDMAYMFKGCKALEVIDVSNFVTDKVEDMGSMFYECNAVKKLDVSKFNTANVIKMICMFYQCSSVTELDVDEFNVSGVTSFQGLFEECSSLTTLDLSTWNPTKCTSYLNMFEQCKSITTIDLSNWDTSKVTIMSGMFDQCVNLQTIYVSDLWDTSSLAPTTDSVFRDCTSLVGGQGTTFDSSVIDATYARIDEAITANIPGYLTLKGAPALDYTLKTGSEFNTAVGTSVTKITFGNYADYKTNFSTWTEGTILDSGNVGTIRLFKNGTEAYVLVNGFDKIYANEDSGSMFIQMSSLTEIIGLNLLDTSNVTKMSYMFMGCTALTQLDLSNFNTSHVTMMDNMFWACEKLEKIDVSSFDTSNVDTMDTMFMACVALTNLDISNFNTSNVTNMDFMFSYLSQIEILDLSNFDTRKVTTTLKMFYNSNKLETIYVGENWDMNSVNKSDGMFLYCTSLVGGQGTKYDDVHIDHTYARIDKAKTDNIPGYLTLKEVSTIDYTLKDGYDFRNAVDTNVTKITFGNYADYKTIFPTWTEGTILDINNLGNIRLFKSGTEAYVLVNGFNKIYANENSGSMFSDMNQLSQIDGLKVLDTSNAKNMSYMFYECSSLTELNLSSFITSNAMQMMYMFYGCSSLTTLDLSSFNTSSVTTMMGMFSRCTLLEKLDISSFNTSSVEGNGFSAMFSECGALKYIDVSRFDTSNATDLSHMFYGCSSVTELDLSSFDTSQNTSTFYMFRGCSKLETIYVSELWSVENVTYDTYTFYESPLLTGGEGTKYVLSNPTGKTYARIDGGYDAPGYLTQKGTATLVSGSTFNSAVGTDVTKITFGNFDNYASKYNFDWDVDGKAILEGGDDQARLFKKDTEAFILGKYVNFQANSDCMLMFNGMEKLTEIVGLNLLSTKEVRHMLGMFSGCKSLKSIDLSNFDTSSAIGLNYMFFGCSSLTSLDLSSFDTSRVENGFSEMFSGCAGLIEIQGLENFKISTTEFVDLTHMFLGCSSLTSLDLSSFDTSKVRNFVSMFYGCTNLKTIYVSESWNTNSVEASDNMFSGCTNLVGGMGMKYDDEHIDHTYARIDGGESDPGYLTKK